MKKIKFIIALATGITICSTTLWGEEADSLQPVGYKHSNAIFYEISYIGDVAANCFGGIKQGVTYLGCAALGFGIDFENLGWWKSGKLFIEGANTHGGHPSETLIGDYQFADNIDVGNYTFLYELWYEQKIRNLSIKLGIQDFNADFAICKTAQLFLNSSHGIHSVLSCNMPLPIFPLTAWSLTMNWDITPKMNLRAGIYDSPIDLEDNPHNLKWRFSREKGFIGTMEYTYKSNIKEHLPGEYSIGVTYHTAEKEYFIHLSSSQTIWEHQQRSIDLFLMCALCQKNTKDNNNHFHIGGGISLNKVFSKKGRDILGLGITSAFLSMDKRNEIALELSYQYQVHDNIYIQPDIQYIINPIGTDKVLKNALFAVLRTEIEL